MSKYRHPSSITIVSLIFTPAVNNKIHLKNLILYQSPVNNDHTYFFILQEFLFRFYMNFIQKKATHLIFNSNIDN